MKQQSKLTTFVDEQEKVRERLNEIDASGEQHDGTRAHIVLGDGRYLSGFPYFGSSDWNRAFIFKDVSQAQQLITDYPTVLVGATVHTVKP